MSNSQSPDQIGPYLILDVLGRGGMGVVYRAKHVETGQSVALKTVHVPNPQRLSSIRREIRALARIRHPGIVRIVDEGIESGFPWYAMELLKGTTLRHYSAAFVWENSDISTAWTSGPESSPSGTIHDGNGLLPQKWNKIIGTDIEIETMDDVIAPVASEDSPKKLDVPNKRVPAAGGSLSGVLLLVCRLCRTLAFLHGEGLVHGDLKPENILIRPNGMPVIMDFGLVTQIWGEEGREILETESIVGGTALYAAPEQIRGEFVDARADLYSFGCILHELITGTVPFIGQTTTEVIRAHLEIKPLLLSDQVEDIPETVDQLVMQLLAKHPLDRISHADDVVTVLHPLIQDDNSLEILPEPKPYLYRSRFAGRGHHMKVMTEHLDRLKSGIGNLVLIGGESGIGKTRFLMELSRKARFRKISVLPGECARVSTPSASTSTETNIPFQGLRNPIQMIGEYCREKGQAETDRVLGPRGKLLAVYEPRLMELPGQNAYPVPPELPSSAARLRLFSAISEVFTEFATENPVLLILDDLQWADDRTLGFLEFFLRIKQLDRIPLLIIGTYRTEEMNASVQRILKIPSSSSFELDRLDEYSIGDIIGDMLAVTEPPALFTKFLSQCSEGNPFFVTEYLRTAIVEKILFRDRHGQWQITEESSREATEKDFQALPLPGAIQGLVERRVNTLSRHAMTLLSTASIIGREIPLLLLWNIMPFSEALLDNLDELIKRQILSEHNPGELQFVHDKIREVVYDNQSREQRANLHKAAALAIESLYGENDEASFTSLAMHWERAGEKNPAKKYYLAGARLAASHHMLLEAEQGYRAYLRLADEPDHESIAVRNEFVGKVLFIKGQFKNALTEYSQSFDEAMGMGNRVLTGHSLLGMANMSKMLGDAAKGHAYCQDALSIFQETGDLESEAIAMSCRGGIYFNQEHMHEAKSMYESAVKIFHNLGMSFQEGVNLANLARILWIQGNLAEARKILERELKAHRRDGNKLFLGRCLGNYATFFMLQGDSDKARTLYEESIFLLRETGDTHTEGIILSNLAAIYSDNNELDKAQEMFEQALEIYRMTEDRRAESVALVNLAILNLKKGTPEKTHTFLKEALTIQQDLRNEPLTANTMLSLATFKLKIEADWKAAENLISKALLIYREMNNILALGLCYCQLGHLALARGKSAENYVSQARTCLEKTKSSSKSDLGKSIEELQNTQTVFDSGGRLFRGYCMDNFPENLKNWLIKTGQWPRD